MENISQTEENYLKAIYKISTPERKPASTNAISRAMDTSAASVTDMVKRLSDKELINYEKYKGVTLTPKGYQIATTLIRNHRIWEVFLFEKLNFSWDEVHEVAEQLEHIKSDTLVDRLDEFLGQPKFDPHGDPIPDSEGNFTYRKQIILSELQSGEVGVIVGVQEHSTAFLQYLDRMNLVLGTQVTLLEKFEFDESISVRVNDGSAFSLSSKVAKNLFVQRSN
ncbi:MAG: metal-dependent transcriptional regulator [Bacteroidota bacterium]